MKTILKLQTYADNLFQHWRTHLSSTKLEKNFQDYGKHIKLPYYIITNHLCIILDYINVIYIAVDSYDMESTSGPFY